MSDLEISECMSKLQTIADNKLIELDGKNSNDWYNINEKKMTTNLCKDAIDFRMSMLDSTLNKNYIVDNHPECVNVNYDEIIAMAKVVRDDKNNIIDDYKYVNEKN